VYLYCIQWGEGGSASQRSTPPTYSNCNYCPTQVTAVPQHKTAVHEQRLYGINRYSAATPKQRRR